MDFACAVEDVVGIWKVSTPEEAHLQPLLGGEKGADGVGVAGAVGVAEETGREVEDFLDVREDEEKELAVVEGGLLDGWGVGLEEGVEVRIGDAVHRIKIQGLL